MEIKSQSQRRVSIIPDWGIQVWHQHPDFQNTPTVIWRDQLWVFLLFLSPQLHTGQQMGDPGGAHKEPEFRCEEPEARYCLLVYGQSSECLRPQRPQSNLRLSEDAGSVLPLYFFLKGTGGAERHLCFIFESVGSVSLLYLVSIHFAPADIVSTMPEVDHRHIQRELGNVIIRLHTPTVISSTAVRVLWTVRALQWSTLVITSSHTYINVVTFIFLHCALLPVNPQWIWINPWIQNETPGAALF